MQIAVGVIGAVLIFLAASRLRSRALEEKLSQMREALSGQFQGVRSEAGGEAQRSREELGANLRGMSDSVARVMGEMGRTQQVQLDAFAGQLRELGRDEEVRLGGASALGGNAPFRLRGAHRRHRRRGGQRGF